MIESCIMNDYFCLCADCNDGELLFNCNDLYNNCQNCKICVVNPDYSNKCDQVFIELLHHVRYNYRQVEIQKLIDKLKLYPYAYNYHFKRIRILVSKYSVKL